MAGRQGGAHLGDERHGGVGEQSLLELASRGDAFAAVRHSHARPLAERGQPFGLGLANVAHVLDLYTCRMVRH